MSEAPEAQAMQWSRLNSDKRFGMEVLSNSNVLAEGTGHSKKLAEQAAAKAALELMGQ